MTKRNPRMYSWSLKKMYAKYAVPRNNPDITISMSVLTTHNILLGAKLPTQCEVGCV